MGKEPTLKRPVILFCVSSLGLGHAARTLPLIRSFLEDHTVHVMTTGGALRLLRDELSEGAVTFHECVEYPPLERGVGVMYVVYLIIDTLRTVVTIRREHRFVTDLACSIQPACIISDGRYGAHVDGIPSFLISHQISFLTPRRPRWVRALVDRVNAHYLWAFDRVLIPDDGDSSRALAGELSHAPSLAHIPHEHIGILSSLARRPIERDIDVLFSIGGFLSAHKPDQVERIRALAQALPGKKVLITGTDWHDTEDVVHTRDLEVYGFVSRDLRQTLFNRARFVVTRGGYTTVMDLVELGTPGLLLPTEGQLEQEYLAEHLQRRGLFVAASFDELLPAHISTAQTSVSREWSGSRTEETVRRVRSIVADAIRPIFISLIVPAHNEAGYLQATLGHLARLEYPRDRYEVLVVENGSSDDTLAIARAAAGGNVRVYTSARGVSRAKNIGLSHVAAESDWVVFLDADTHLAPGFLRELDRFVRDRRNGRCVVGTTAVQPWGNTSTKARMWFAFYNLGHRLTDTSYAIQIMKASFRSSVQFDETIAFAEDLALIHALKRRGSFSFLNTKTVSTSTRRFDAVGWVRQFIRWNWEALVLSKTRRKVDPYRVVR
jgi:UDP-N-acetylglucosamine transferase subunit ALG13